MNSTNEIATEVRALQAVVGVLVRNRKEHPEFQQQLIDLVNHMAKDLTHKQAEDFRVATQQLIDQ